MTRHSSSNGWIRTRESNFMERERERERDISTLICFVHKSRSLDPSLPPSIRSLDLDSVCLGLTEISGPHFAATKNKFPSCIIGLISRETNFARLHAMTLIESAGGEEGKRSMRLSDRYRTLPLSNLSSLCPLIEILFISNWTYRRDIYNNNSNNNIRANNDIRSKIKEDTKRDTRVVSTHA